MGNQPSDTKTSSGVNFTDCYAGNVGDCNKCNPGGAEGFFSCGIGNLVGTNALIGSVDPTGGQVIQSRCNAATTCQEAKARKQQEAAAREAERQKQLEEQRKKQQEQNVVLAELERAKQEEADRQAAIEAQKNPRPGTGEGLPPLPSAASSDFTYLANLYSQSAQQAYRAAGYIDQGMLPGSGYAKTPATGFVVSGVGGQETDPFAGQDGFAGFGFKTGMFTVIGAAIGFSLVGLMDSGGVRGYDTVTQLPIVSQGLAKPWYAAGIAAGGGVGYWASNTFRVPGFSTA